MVEREATPRFQESGIDDLIERLRDDGVAAGKREAARIVEEAERRADWIVNQAEQQAEELRRRAEADAQRYRRSAEDALQTAVRDAVLSLKNKLTQKFRSQTETIVSTTLSDQAFMQTLIRDLLAQISDNVQAEPRGELNIRLPKDVIGVEELRRQPESLEEGSLSHFVAHLAQALLAEGIQFDSGPQGHGLRVQLKDTGVEIDLSDKALAELLLQHLQPRYHALMDGIISG